MARATLWQPWFTLEQMGPLPWPGVVWIGRSNVGKSSLLNVLLGEGLARTSNTPGRTQGIFLYQAHGMLLIDLPGYGFSAKKELPADIIRGFFHICKKDIVRVMVLVDCRHGLKPIDANTVRYFMHLGLSVELVFSKMDKLRTSERAAFEPAITDQLHRLGFDVPKIHCVSVLKRQGIAELLEHLKGLGEG